MNICVKKGMRNIITGAMAIAMLLGIMQPMTIEAAEERIEIPAFSKAPTIDGVVNPEEWGEVALVLKEGEKNVNLLKDHIDREEEVPKFDFTADVYLGYDATHIYVAAVAKYETHINETTKTADVWKGDSLQLMLSATPGKDRNEFNMSCNSLSGLSMMDPYECAGKFTMQSGEGKDYLIVRDGTTTTYELAISIDQLSKDVEQFKSGMELLFGILFHRHDGYFVEYMAGIAREKDITLGGTLVLTGDAKEPVSAASDGKTETPKDNSQTATESKGTGNILPIAIGVSITVILIAVLVWILFHKKKEK